MIIPTSPAVATQPEPQELPARAGGVLRWSALGVAVTSAGGITAATMLRRNGYGLADRASEDIFFRLYALHERPFFVLLGIFALLTWFYARTPPARPEDTATARARPRVSPIAALWIGAAVVGVISWVGSYVVLHSFPFAMDEYNAVFQAKIFAAGRLTAPVPAQWQPFAPALSPVFVTYFPDQHTWRSGYLPVYSAIRALFSLAGADNLTNPLLGSLTVVMMAAVGRRLWPAMPQRTWLAVVFLATSSQFLFMSMSWYSMPAHLLLNLLWLWLYLRNDTLSLAVAPIVGVLALGLHNPFPHALFVAPFLIRALRQRRFGWLGYAAVVYGAGSLVWYSWLRASSGYLQATGGLVGAFSLPGAWQVRIQALQLSLVLSWQAPLVVILALVAVVRWRKLGTTERDLAVGLVLTAAFFTLFPLTQGHGWGDRYIYSALGNLMILAAVAGGDLAEEGLGMVRVGRLVAASTLVALLIQVPLRAVQVEHFVRPFARAAEYAATRPEPAVIIYPDSSYYGRDLVRNDPFLQHSPKILSAPVLGDSGVRRLRAGFGSPVHQLRPAELAPFGIATF
ncbi:MAG: hypothetical protein ACR2M1_02755 [Gemmatimonadaceae bacterium]